MTWLPQPDRLLADTAAGTAQRYLVISDGGALTQLLAQRLLVEGASVSVLDLDTARMPDLPRDARAYASSMEEPALHAIVNRIVAEAGGVDGLIDLEPEPIDLPPSSAGWLRTKARLRALLAIAGQLKLQLTGSAAQPRKTFMTVTRLDGVFGLRDWTEPPLHAALFGLTKSLAWEWPTTFCRALDIRRGLDPAAAAERILAELHDAQCDLVQVGWDGEQRSGLRALDHELAGDDCAGVIDASEVFLVSGGARGVTADCVLELARRSRCGFVVVGRSAIDDALPAWAAEVDAEPELRRKAADQLRVRGDKPTPVKIAKLIDPILAQRECRTFLAEVRALGSRVAYVRCDVTQPAALRVAVAEAARPLGAITGIIHGAGVLADKLVEKKTFADFDRVFDTKVEGLAALLACVDPAVLRYLALFSSVAGFFGNRGQTDYAMANEVLNAWAAVLLGTHPHCRVVSYNFGPWNGGMVSPALRTLLVQQGVPLIDRRGGAEVFVDALRSAVPADPPHLIVGATVQPVRAEAPLAGRTHRLQRRIDPAQTPLLVDHCIGGKRVLPITHAASWMASSCEDVYPGERFYRMENLRLFKGVILDEHLPEVFDVNLVEQATASPLIRHVSAAAGARNASGRQQPYYRADVFLRSTPVARCTDGPGVTAFTDFDLREDPAWVDRNPYRDGTLFHGPAFQSIQRVLNVSDRGVTVRCHSARVSDRAAGQFRTGVFDPYRFDACFQAFLIWVRSRYDAASLPMGLDWGEVYCLLPDEGMYFVTVHVTEHTPTAALCDLYAHDERGKLYGRLGGAKVVISKDLNRMFAPEVRAAALSAEAR